MCRLRKKLLLRTAGVCAAAITVGLVFMCGTDIREDPVIQNEICIIERYKNLEIPVRERKGYSAEKIEGLTESVLEQLDHPQTKEQFLQRTAGTCSSRKELLELVSQSLAEEEIYEAENEKRQGVLRAILGRSRFQETVEDREEAVLLSIYEKEGLTLTEEEREAGMEELKKVFGAESAEKLNEFLNTEEQLRIIKKEKTYEYLLENNHFVNVSDIFVSKERSGGRVSGFCRLQSRVGG